MSSRDEENSTSTIPSSRRRRKHTASTFQSEITPASSHGGSCDEESSTIVPIKGYMTIVELIQHVRLRSADSHNPALNELISLTKEKNERNIRDIVSHGAIPVLLKILADPKRYDIETRIRVAAAICNISISPASQRSFCSCYAVPTLVASVIGEHQALTGASALMMKAMLTSEYLVKSMVEHEAPIFLLRAFMLCNNSEICDTIVEVLIQMASIDELKSFMLERKMVEICVYMLHVLARCHYYSMIRLNESSAEDEPSQPSFTYKSMRDVLIWYLTQHDGEAQYHSKEQEEKVASPEELFFPQRMNHDGWERKLKTQSFLKDDECEVPFSKTDVVRAALFLELLACLLNGSSNACSRITAMQFSMDILRYWMRKGNSTMRQRSLLSTCFLLRDGHRGFVTLKDIIDVIRSILKDAKYHKRKYTLLFGNKGQYFLFFEGLQFVQYKGTAVEAVNDLCIFGGDNVRLAIDDAGILQLMLQLLERKDYQLQHLSLRAIHSVCSHRLPLRNLVSIGAISILCTFLNNGLSDMQSQMGGGLRRGKSIPKSLLGCLSRKRVATISISEAEVHASQKREEYYSRFRRLDYCAAILRSISAMHCNDAAQILNKAKIIPLALDALVQNQSTVIRRQALGILHSLVTMKDSNAVVSLGLEDGCELLLNLRSHYQRSGDVDSVYWIAWINLILYHIAQQPKLLKTLEQAVKAQFSEEVDTSRNGFSKMFKPNQAHLDLEWLSSCM